MHEIAPHGVRASARRLQSGGTPWSRSPGRRSWSPSSWPPRSSGSRSCASSSRAP